MLNRCISHGRGSSQPFQALQMRSYPISLHSMCFAYYCLQAPFIEHGAWPTVFLKVRCWVGSLKQNQVLRSPYREPCLASTQTQGGCKDQQWYWFGSFFSRDVRLFRNDQALEYPLYCVHHTMALQEKFTCPPQIGTRPCAPP